MKNIGYEEVINFSRGRAILETELCRRMYHAYNSSPIIDQLRPLIALAVEQICALELAGGGKDELLWMNAIKKAGAKLAIWPRYLDAGSMLTVRNLIKVLDRCNSWTAADCSDLVRFFGGMIEDSTLQNVGLAGKDVDELRLAQRVGPGFKKEERARIDGPYRATLPHIAAAHHAVLDFKRDKTGFSGFANVALQDHSTVKKIDAVFGLAEGCDISGTTADSLFFFRHVNAFIAGLREAVDARALPLIQLLPLATMASQGHHTILECGLTLTLNRIIEYRIGFYTTLIPAGIPPGALRSIFSLAEQDARNKHILCFWENGCLQGILYDTPEEIASLSEASVANEEFRSQFTKLSLRPSKSDLFSLPCLRRLPH